MFGYLILLFTLLPALELAIIIKAGTYIGIFNTLFIIVFTGVIGAYLARLQGFIILNKIQSSLNQGKMPSSELLDGLMILAGGIVLLTPGFITDAIGFFLLIPATRVLIKSRVKKFFEGMIRKGHVSNVTQFGHSNNHYDDIDVN